MLLRKISTLCLLTLLLFQVGRSQVLVFHNIQTDSSGNLIPWYTSDPGLAYDHDLQLIWNFWKNIPTSGGDKLYMMDHSYSPTLQSNKVGGDQFAMALSSWALYYAYTGDTSLIDNMNYIARTYLANSLSSNTDAWANLPYPCNASNNSIAVYDGDYIWGVGYTQPDKAGSFANELVTLYKITGDNNYLNAAVAIANTLAAKVVPGDSLNSPYPFKVKAQDGSVLTTFQGANYTTDFVPTLSLFEQLTALGVGNTSQYNSAYSTVKTWIQRYPQHNNNWGCFFEDIFLPSNTETNAVTMAMYILNHPDWSATYKQDARNILDWTFNTFQDTVWNQYGATAIFEQSVDLKPGGSHTSRYASIELMYAEKTGDTNRVAEAIRQLNWATYLCDTSGQCRFSPSEGSVWYTDGYGDYVRHFIRAMASYPQIAPSDANHLLGSTSVITHITYLPLEIDYNTWDSASNETFRLTSKPVAVYVDGNLIAEQSNLNTQGWVWTAYATGGSLKVLHTNGHTIKISWYPASVNKIVENRLNAELYPNPASGTFTLSYSLSHDQKVSIELSNVSGQKVGEIQVHAQNNLNNQEISLANISPGIYFVKLTSDEGSFLKKLVVSGK